MNQTGKPLAEQSLELGVCYYPEHWPQDMWAADAKKMRELGISWVRIGEFAWSMLEPAAGEYQFAWLDQAIAVLKDAGLRVVLGTPTACPPRWMESKIDDLYLVDAQGRSARFGSRRHYTHASSDYRDECVRIAGALAQRYGSQVDAWQIDNEYGCHGTAISYGPADEAAFRVWAKKRYGTIDALNQAWGNAFWSMQYSSFDELAAPIMMPADPNPAHVLAWRRCASDLIVQFNRAQAQAIRAHSKAPITHNFMADVFDFDHYAVSQDLDFACWDSYPLGHLLRNAPVSQSDRVAYARQGLPDYQSFFHDLYREVGHDRLWIMEQQPGPVNWATHNPAPQPGMVRQWAWAAFAHGASVVSFFRWRQCPYAQEQMHAGLLLPDSSESPAYAEIAQVAQEARQLRTLPARTRSAAALVFDYDSYSYWAALPHGADFDYGHLAYGLYSALRSIGIEVDIVPPTAEAIADRKLVLIAGLACVSQDFADALVASGATVLAGLRSGSKTAEFSIPDSLPPDTLAAHCGLRAYAVESLPAHLIEEIPGVGRVGKWLEHIKLQDDCTIVLQTQAGKPVLAQSGSFFYLAAWPEQQAAQHIARLLAQHASIPILDLPAGVRISDRTDKRFIFNFLDQQVQIGHLCADAQQELEGCSMLIHEREKKL